MIYIQLWTTFAVVALVTGTVLAHSNVKYASKAKTYFFLLPCAISFAVSMLSVTVIPLFWLWSL